VSVETIGAPPATAAAAVVLVGRESVGKSQLLASLAGAPAYVANFRGSTLSCDEYAANGFRLVDTPGILYRSDTETTRAALERLDGADVVMLVVQGTHLGEDLAELLPLVAGRRGVVVATFWDRVDDAAGAAELAALRAEHGVEVIPVDARHVGEAERTRIWAALAGAGRLPRAPVRRAASWRVEPQRTLLERGAWGRLAAALLLLAPGAAAVALAYAFSAAVEERLGPLLEVVAAAAAGLPSLPAELLVGDYGLLTMGPLLLVWAVPAVVLYAVLLGVYKASGLIERISVVLHPWVRRFGLGGRDLVRVVMGFGCNVPAVTSTRACSSCTRGTCISAVAFGAACSYQLGATLGVFAAAGKPWLAAPYMLLLGASTLLYARAVSPPVARSPLNVLTVENRTFIVWPTAAAVWREAHGTLSQFFRQVLPVFLAIALAASLLHWLGTLRLLAAALAPLMALFGLPAEAATPVLMASVRKDGILLFAEPGTLASLSSLQLLTGVFLAGVLVPCLVTALTIAREMSWRFAGALLLRQAGAAVVFSLMIAWGGRLLARAFS
jgi:ferrous iron transport protein B